MNKIISWKCPNCLTEYDIDEKFSKVLESKKDCKFCVRKDPYVPTTAEMDGLRTQKDMRERNQIVLQCGLCNRWTEQTNNKKYTPCTGVVDGKPYVDGRGKVVAGCGKLRYDNRSLKSKRTYNTLIDNNRRPGDKKNAKQ